LKDGSRGTRRRGPGDTGIALQVSYGKTTADPTPTYKIRHLKYQMNKLELIQALKDATDLTKPEAAAVVNIFFNGMANELANGGRVEIRGLCSFFVKEYRAYTGRNPKTGEKVKIKPKKLPFFKVGKELRERVDR